MNDLIRFITELPTYIKGLKQPGSSWSFFDRYFYIKIQDVEIIHKTYINKEQYSFLNEMIKASEREYGIKKETLFKEIPNNEKNNRYLNRSLSDAKSWLNYYEPILNNLKQYQEAINTCLSENVDSESALINLSSILLAASYIPFEYERNYEVEYLREAKHLVINFVLPDKTEIPHTKRNKSGDRVNLSETALSKLYEICLYGIILKVCYELSSNIPSDKVNFITVNGWVNTRDKSTGIKIKPCILSIQVQPENLKNIDIDYVDPASWFKSNKGISAAKIANQTPIKPIIQFDKNDKRFSASYSVNEKIDESFNLAAMDWQDFEQLIRELFEKEFNQSGGEVKITRASRDGGVDAVAFDPDPLRGGKIVIQAKRYTNVVGLSAVRDLYGTVLNEGANKGILITTAQYGADSYEFAKGKPLTLLSGNELLYLLEKHGHKAYIDIGEAKSMLGLKTV